MSFQRNFFGSTMVSSVFLTLNCVGSRLDASDHQPEVLPTATAFYVSPHGKDNWSGRLADLQENDGPFATITRARDAVRTLRKTQKEPRPARVVLRGGTYILDLPLEFGPEDSGSQGAPVVYAAPPGETVVLSGGRRLTGGKWDEVHGRKAWVLDIPEVKEGKWNFHQLFVNGERRPRTRLPKEAYYHIEAVPEYNASESGDDQHNNVRRFVSRARTFSRGITYRTWRSWPSRHASPTACRSRKWMWRSASSRSTVPAAAT